MIAARSGHVDICSLLVDRGAYLDFRDKVKLCPHVES